MAKNDDEQERPLTNMRRYRQESDKKLLLLVIGTLVIVGGGLIAVIFGPESLLTAVPCLLGGALLILIPWGILTALEKWRARSEAQYRAALESTDETEGSM